MKRLLLVSLFLVAVYEGFAYEPLKRRIYMFGFAASFTDSIAYITDVQAIDSAYVHYNGFLADRTLYAAQLNVYLQSHLKKKDMTCVVYFNKNKSKLEKKYLRVKKKYTSAHGIPITPLGRDRFHFTREEWVEPTVSDVPFGKAAEQGGSKKK